MKKFISLSMPCILILLSGCAFDVIRVEQTPVKIVNTESCKQSFVLTEKADIKLKSGYSRTLNKGTRWHCVGEISQGTVYKSNDQILTVEASNIFEVSIVVSSNSLVGFYLPVEGTFSPLHPPIQLSMR